MNAHDWTGSSRQVRRSGDLADLPAPSMWRSIRSLWCQHSETFVTRKTAAMPAHTVCAACGWREPVVASVPQGVRTWDSSRDSERYEREKKRRVQLEERRQMAIAEIASAASKPGRARRGRRTNVFELKRASGA